MNQGQRLGSPNSGRRHYERAGMMGAKSQADEASGPAELISSASKGRRHDRSRDVHSIFKATLDHGAPSRQDRSPRVSRPSIASKNGLSASDGEVPGGVSSGRRRCEGEIDSCIRCSAYPARSASLSASMRKSTAAALARRAVSSPRSSSRGVPRPMRARMWPRSIIRSE